MTRLDVFFEDPNWISKNLRFRVTPRQASQAVEKMLEVGLLTRDSANRLQVAENNIHAGNAQASEAIKRYHEQMLDNGRQGVRAIPFDEREYSSLILPMRASRMVQARELVKEFKEKFSELLEEAGGDAVYALQIQLYPLTKTKKQCQVLGN